MTVQVKGTMATPVRNIRIPDLLWEKLGKLATQRKTTITALVVEGVEYILDVGEYSKPTPPSTEETLTRLATLEKEFQTLSLQVNESGGHVKVQSVTSTDETLTDLSQRLDRIEKAIAPVIEALKKVPQLVLIEPIEVKDADFEISSPTLPPDLKPPLSQRELSERWRSDKPAKSLIYQAFYLVDLQQDASLLTSLLRISFRALVIIDPG